jgi:hypothetical protein
MNCKNIFFDVGANIGMHTRFLFEPERYPIPANPPTYQYAHDYAAIFDKHFSPRKTNETKKDYCSIGFEPNPVLTLHTLYTYIHKHIHSLTHTHSNTRTHISTYTLSLTHTHIYIGPPRQTSCTCGCVHEDGLEIPLLLCCR